VERTAAPAIALLIRQGRDRLDQFGEEATLDFAAAPGARREMALIVAIGIWYCHAWSVRHSVARAAKCLGWALSWFSLPFGAGEGDWG
jgi:hypothetical protein